MQVAVYQGAAEFLRNAQCFLEEREAENNLLLGLCMRMANETEDVEFVPGVLGESSSAAAFADSWSGISGAAVTRVACQRIYQLREGIPQYACPGSFRAAEEDDQTLLSQ